MKRHGTSLRGRIVWSTAVVTAIAMTAVTGTVVLILAALSRNSIDAALDDRLALISSAVESVGDGQIRPLQASDDSVADSTWVFDAGGTQVEGPNAGRRVQSTAESLARVTRRTTVERRERIYLAAPVAARGSTTPNAVVVVSQSLEPYESTRMEVIALLGALGVLVTAGSTAVAAWTVRRALAPVESMATLADDWSENELESRFAQDGRSNDEITVLGHTLNHLLDRVSGALLNEQRLTAELAHELRTPLTAIRGEAELGLLTTSDQTAVDRLTEVIRLVDRMTVTITSLLAVARGEADRDIVSDIDDVIAAVLADRPARTDVSCVVEAADGQAVVAPLALAVRALAPLVDNAFHHAATSVRITATVSERTVEVSVTDDGPGVQDVAVDDLFEPGRRGTTSPGAGLGLSLSRRVARTLGGNVSVTSAGSPTTFTMSLPRS